MTELRKELPPLPDRIKKLPIDDRGYPVPRFVQWVLHGRPVQPGQGKPDFRIMDYRYFFTAVNEGKCWICGDRLGTYVAFNIGPMCAINRVSSEPPSHQECAEFAVKACPFLTRPHMVRREAQMPPGAIEAPGQMLRRNPGVAMVWTTKSFEVVRASNGYLIKVGDPREIKFFTEGRISTREEIARSVASGIPLLAEAAETEGADSVRQLWREIDRGLPLLGLTRADIAA